jgi:hypothetical protein
MLEKDTGAPRINQLRIIHLFEVDFNLFLKLQWGSCLVKHAGKHDLLNDGQQHASKPERVSMDPVMLTQLTTDLSRLLKVSLVRQRCLSMLRQDHCHVRYACGKALWHANERSEYARGSAPTHEIRNQDNSWCL